MVSLLTGYARIDRHKVNIKQIILLSSNSDKILKVKTAIIELNRDPCIR